MTTASDIKPSVILKTAHDIIATAGWCQGHLKNHAGQVCAAGAVAEAYKTFGVEVAAYGDSDSRNVAWDYLSDIAADQLAADLTHDYGDGNIVDLNDRKGMSREQILDVFYDAIAEAKADGR